LDEKESEALGADGELPKEKEEGLIWKLEDVKGESEEKDAKKEKASENFKEPITKEENLKGKIA